MFNLLFILLTAYIETIYHILRSNIKEHSYNTVIHAQKIPNSLFHAPWDFLGRRQ
jgi:hypothetical protein